MSDGLLASAMGLDVANQGIGLAEIEIEGLPLLQPSCYWGSFSML